MFFYKVDLLHRQGRSLFWYYWYSREQERKKIFNSIRLLFQHWDKLKVTFKQEKYFRLGRQGSL